MRFTILILTTLCCLFIFVSCGDNGTENGDDKVQIVNGERYFPLAQGDKWFYNSDLIIREIDGDTTINGYSCQRVLLGGQTDEAWSLTSERFAQHMLLGTEAAIWLDPPLGIPLDLEKGKPFEVSSIARFVGIEGDVARIEGTLTFAGYTTRQVDDVSVDSCIKLDYQVNTIFLENPDTVVEEYSEFWAPGIGLILVDDPDDYLSLDSAIIGGVKVP